MSNKGIVTKVAPTESMAKVSMGLDPQSDSTLARILSMTIAAGGAEKIDPTSLVTGKKPKLIACATIGAP